MNRRRLRMFVLAGYFVAGAYVTQFLTLCTSTGTAGLSSSGILIDNNGYLFGLVHVCGAENFVLVSEVEGVPISAVANQNDDLMFGCPVTQVVVPGSAIGGGDGDIPP